MANVTQDGWGVSTVTGTDIDGAILHVYKARFGGRKFQHGDAYGMKFKNSDEAFAYALAHGYTHKMETAWCRTCRVRHTSIVRNSHGEYGRSSFCEKTGTFAR